MLLKQYREDQVEGKLTNLIETKKLYLQNP